MKLEPLIKTIICQGNIDNFTAGEVRTAYIVRILMTLITDSHQL
ncbi:hypothetical protein [Pseudoalteromonas rhizosphaerae]|uniref:Uncharacterized protein n=1 Tax=Pseudoalteromonas rhizosphaerae TaxID=2518973 RepID=A0ABW8L4P9_9GAMM